MRTSPTTGLLALTARLPLAVQGHAADGGSARHGY